MFGGTQATNNVASRTAAAQSTSCTNPGGTVQPPDAATGKGEPACKAIKLCFVRCGIIAHSAMLLKGSTKKVFYPIGSFSAMLHSLKLHAYN